MNKPRALIDLFEPEVKNALTSNGGEFLKVSLPPVNKPKGSNFLPKPEPIVGLGPYDAEMAKLKWLCPGIASFQTGFFCIYCAESFTDINHKVQSKHTKKKKEFENIERYKAENELENELPKERLVIGLDSIQEVVVSECSDHNKYFCCACNFITTKWKMKNHIYSFYHILRIINQNFEARFWDRVSLSQFPLVVLMLASKIMWEYGPGTINLSYNTTLGVLTEGIKEEAESTAEPCENENIEQEDLEMENMQIVESIEYESDENVDMNTESTPPIIETNIENNDAIDIQKEKLNSSKADDQKGMENQDTNPPKIPLNLNSFSTGEQNIASTIDNESDTSQLLKIDDKDVIIEPTPNKLLIECEKSSANPPLVQSTHQISSTVEQPSNSLTNSSEVPINDSKNSSKESEIPRVELNSPSKIDMSDSNSKPLNENEKISPGKTSGSSSNKNNSSLDSHQSTTDFENQPQGNQKEDISVITPISKNITELSNEKSTTKIINPSLEALSIDTSENSNSNKDALNVFCEQNKFYIPFLSSPPCLETPKYDSSLAKTKHISPVKVVPNLDLQEKSPIENQSLLKASRTNPPKKMEQNTLISQQLKDLPNSTKKTLLTLDETAQSSTRSDSLQNQSIKILVTQRIEKNSSSNSLVSRQVKNLINPPKNLSTTQDVTSQAEKKSLNPANSTKSPIQNETPQSSTRSDSLQSQSIKTVVTPRIDKNASSNLTNPFTPRFKPIKMHLVSKEKVLQASPGFEKAPIHPKNKNSVETLSSVVKDTPIPKIVPTNVFKITPTVSPLDVATCSRPRVVSTMPLERLLSSSVSKVADCSKPNVVSTMPNERLSTSIKRKANNQDSCNPNKAAKVERIKAKDNEFPKAEHNVTQFQNIVNPSPLPDTNITFTKNVLQSPLSVNSESLKDVKKPSLKPSDQDSSEAEISMDNKKTKKTLDLPPIETTEDICVLNHIMSILYQKACYYRLRNLPEDVRVARHAAAVAKINRLFEEDAKPCNKFKSHLPDKEY